tara:strand:- start:1033 stop:1320 length:288 start_codon:yes stop_codon:yes gene_type:complete
MKLIMEHWRKYLAEATATSIPDGLVGQRWAVKGPGTSNYQTGYLPSSLLFRDEDDVEAEEEDSETEEEADENEATVSPYDPIAPEEPKEPEEPIE